MSSKRPPQCPKYPFKQTERHLIQNYFGILQFKQLFTFECLPVIDLFNIEQISTATYRLRLNDNVNKCKRLHQSVVYQWRLNVKCTGQSIVSWLRAYCLCLGVSCNRVNSHFRCLQAWLDGKIHCQCTTNLHGREWINLLNSSHDILHNKGLCCTIEQWASMLLHSRGVFVRFGVQQHLARGFWFIEHTQFFLEACRSLVAKIYIPSSVIGRQ